MTLNKEKKKKIAEKLLMSEEEYQEYLEKLKERDRVGDIVMIEKEYIKMCRKAVI